MASDELREKIAMTVASFDDPMIAHMDYHAVADAVLALLPSRNDVLEEAARVAETLEAQHPMNETLQRNIGRNIAKALRTLKDPT